MKLDNPSATPTAARLLHAPVDDNPAWLAIFERLAASIGMDAALAWFGHCRFAGVSDASTGRIDLAHWNAFSARECLKYGFALCRAAQVGEARVYRSGGYRPSGISGEARNASGFERCRMPPPKPEAAALERVAAALANAWTPSAPVLKPDPTAGAYAGGAALEREARERWAAERGADKPLPEPK